MLYLEELVDAVIAEEGQTLMGLDFLMETLSLPMKKIELIFKKSLSEYSERRPMKKTEVFNNFDMDGYITMPEGTTSCRVARYGILPNQMPRYYMPTFGEVYVEFDPTTLACRVWPQVTPLRLTYTKRYVPTKTLLIENSFNIPYTTDEFETTLNTMYGGSSLKVIKSTESGEVLEMVPTGNITEESDVFGKVTKYAELEGTLGTGTVNLETREMSLSLTNTSVGSIILTYYPKYYVVKELDLGDFIFTKLFASKLITALASLRAQATQAKLHNIDLTTDELYSRAQELKEEVRSLLKSTISYGDMSPV